MQPCLLLRVQVVGEIVGVKFYFGPLTKIDVNVRLKFLNMLDARPIAFSVRPQADRMQTKSRRY